MRRRDEASTACDGSRSRLLSFSPSSVPDDAAGKEVPNGEQLNAKCSFSRRLFCKRSLPPDPLRRDQQKPASDQKVTYQKPCHKKKQ
ncbi:hypothetical protein ABVT39_002430 [Epinephelus coioides]